MSSLVDIVAQMIGEYEREETDELAGEFAERLLRTIRNYDQDTKKEIYRAYHVAENTSLIGGLFKETVLPDRRDE